MASFNALNSLWTICGNSIVSDPQRTISECALSLWVGRLTCTIWVVWCDEYDATQVTISSYQMFNTWCEYYLGQWKLATRTFFLSMQLSISIDLQRSLGLWICLPLKLWMLVSISRQTHRQCMNYANQPNVHAYDQIWITYYAHYPRHFLPPLIADLLYLTSGSSSGLYYALPGIEYPNCMVLGSGFV